MNRRKYLAAVGSIAASGAFAMGTGASIDIWANRDTNVDVVRDTDGLIALSTTNEDGEPLENAQFTDTRGGTLSIDLTNQEAGGVNVGARTTIDAIFSIRNQSGNDQVVWIKDSDTEDLLGDDGPLNFFRGPVELDNGAQQKKFRLVSAIDPVPGTPGNVQRLSITGLVPPQNIIEEADEEAQKSARKGWINKGAPIENVNTKELVGIDPNVGIGAKGGRLRLTSGESMTVGLDADFAGYELNNGNLENADGDDLGSAEDPLPNQIQIVSRGVEDAKDLATGNTEFNPE
jgi:hypothetical protein